jgi:hypothetical protein
VNAEILRQGAEAVIVVACAECRTTISIQCEDPDEFTVELRSRLNRRLVRAGWTEYYDEAYCPRCQKQFSYQRKLECPLFSFCSNKACFGDVCSERAKDEDNRKLGEKNREIRFTKRMERLKTALSSPVQRVEPVQVVEVRV